MSSLSEFKKYLEEHCGIVRWSPSERDLKEIAQRVTRAQPRSADELAIVVLEVCPDLIRLSMEGLDNSDLRALLALATAAAAKG